MLLSGEIESLGERGYFLRDGFLDDETVRVAREQALAMPFRAAGISRGATVASDTRGDLMTWADEGFVLWPRFEALRGELNREAYLGLERFDLQIAKYPGGGARYARHRDAFKDAAGSVRRLTAIVYLNPAWGPEHGGVLRLYAPDPVDLAPVGGRLVAFLADLEHEVLPAFAERLAVTAWYHRR